MEEGKKMTPVWLETWRVWHHGNVEQRIVGDDRSRLVTIGEHDEAVSIAELAAKAPALARLLLKLEWRPDDKSSGGPDWCVVCEKGWSEENAHAHSCELDALLTELGLPDAASRDAARKLIAEASK